MLARPAEALLGRLARAGFAGQSKAEFSQWQVMKQQGHKINPCNSKLHPAAKAGIPPEADSELSVQEAYNPSSACFGCGNAHPDGLKLKSYRIDNGLEARVVVPSKYCAFPGIVNGGIISTLLDCHGNWTAAVALMDRSSLPKPPLTLTATIYVAYKEPTPPDTELLLRSKVVGITGSDKPGVGKATVEVDVSLYEPGPGGAEKLLVHGTGMYKRMGALRAM